MTGEADEPANGDDPTAASSTLTTTPRQLFTGLPVGPKGGRLACSTCGDGLYVGDDCGIYAYQRETSPSWTVSCVYCPTCTPERIDSPTRGTSEVLLAALLATVLDLRNAYGQCCLTAVEPLDCSPSTTGADP